jgi:ubiquinone/menaquinone biosynthesis C-methylase UbiE
MEIATRNIRLTGRAAVEHGDRVPDRDTTAGHEPDPADLAALYRRRMAEQYDTLNPWAADSEFYLELVMSASSVLDVGCGTGMLLHRARQAGHQGRLCGLDPDPAMLDQARVRPDVDWVLARAASMTWDREFDLAVMTGHAFQQLVTDEDLRTSLAAIRRALCNGGRFAFETRNPAVRPWQRWRPGTVEIADDNGDTVVVRRHHRTVVLDDVVHIESVADPGGSREHMIRSSLRFVDVDTLARFLTGAGLVVEEQFGDWDRSPLTSTSSEIITIARRA